MNIKIFVTNNIITKVFLEHFKISNLYSDSQTPHDSYQLFNIDYIQLVPYITTKIVVD